MESIDTTTPTGKLTFHATGVLAEFERSIIIERTRRVARTLGVDRSALYRHPRKFAYTA